MRFLDLVNSLASKVSASYLDEGKSPTEELAKLASSNDLSELQISRVVNKANRNIIVGIQKSAAGKDPHFTFPIIKTSEVMAIMVPKASANSVSLQQKSVKNKVDDLLNKLFPQSKGTMPSTHGDTPSLALSRFDSGLQATSSRNTMLQALSILRERVRLSKARMLAAENALDMAMLNLEKVAHAAYADNPPKVIKRIRKGFNKSASVNSVLDFAENTASVFCNDDVGPFSVMEENALSKSASAVVDAEEALRLTELEYQEELSRMNRFKKSIPPS